MRVLLYTFLFSKYKAKYISYLRTSDGIIAYGYNKDTNQYIFCDVVGGYKLRLKSVVNSKAKALFYIDILVKGA